MSQCSCTHQNPVYSLSGLSSNDPVLQNLNDILNARSYLSTKDSTSMVLEDKILYGLLIQFELYYYEVQYNNDESKLEALRDVYNTILKTSGDRLQKYSNLHKDSMAVASIKGGGNDENKDSNRFGVGSLVLATCAGAALSAIFIRMRS